MVREKMLLPYHVERWNLMIDTDDAGVIKSLEDFLDEMYQMIRDTFPMTLHKIYLMNVNIMRKIKEDWNRKPVGLLSHLLSFQEAKRVSKDCHYQGKIR